MPLGAEHQRERLTQLNLRKIRFAVAVEPNREKSTLLQLAQRARKILYCDDRNEIERARRGFSENTSCFGRMPRRDDDRAHREGRGRAQDRADIVRIGDLIEHQHNAARIQCVGGRGRQRIGFRQQALMHRISR